MARRTIPTAGTAPAEIVRQRFAQRLQDEIAARNWNQSDLAREASKHLPDGEISRDNISNYMRQRALPNPSFLLALAKAIGTTPDELLPERGMVRPRDVSPHPPFDIADAGQGYAWVQVNKRLPWDAARKIMDIIADTMIEDVKRSRGED